MKKVCPSCKRNRRIGKFAKNSSKPDGKQVYCRECQKKYVDSYQGTFKGLKKKRKANKNWKEKNKEHTKEYNKKYYAKYKERIISRRNTISSRIVENTGIKKINKSRKVRYRDVVIDPKPRRENG